MVYAVSDARRTVIHARRVLGVLTQELGEPHIGSSLPASRGRWVALWEAIRRHSLSVYIAILAMILLLAISGPRILVTVPAGYGGVLFRPLSGGTDVLTRFDEGLHVMLPWNRLVLYDTRLIHSSRTYDVISSTGLAMQVEIAVRYRLDRDFIGLVHARVGPNYAEVLLFPEVDASARELIGLHTPEDIYTVKRNHIQEAIERQLRIEVSKSLGLRYGDPEGAIDIQGVLIRNIQLPPSVAAAIERKTEQQQIMLEYDFRIAREVKEAQRKRTEAEGLRDFQSIVAGTITPEFLKLRGIEATSALAGSPNSKIVIIGGKDGLPVILNTGDSPGDASAGAAKAAPPVRPSSAAASIAPVAGAAAGASADAARSAGARAKPVVPRMQ